MRDFRKVVRIGSISYAPNVRVPIFCKIEVKEGNLSISGVEGPRRNGDCAGSCGQIDMHLRGMQEEITPAPGWDRSKIARFFEVWDRWHLNDMRAGSPVQMQWLQDNPIPAEEYAYPKSHYEVASAKLAAAGLNPDASGYEYGHAWIREDLPADVIAFLQSLPDTDKQPAWV